MKKIPHPKTKIAFSHDIALLYLDILLNRNSGELKDFMVLNLENWVNEGEYYDYILEKHGYLGRRPSNTWLLYKDDFEYLYDKASLKNERSYVFNLRASYRGDLCPYCLNPSSTSLDHFYPISKFPEYSLLISNLVPSCNDCNKIKRSLVPRPNGSRVLNPYYDTFLDKTLFLLDLTINKNNVEYSLKSVSGLKKIEKKMVKYHLNKLQILERSRDLIDKEFRSCLENCRDLQKGNSKREVQKIFKVLAGKGKIFLWKTIVLRSLTVSKKSFDRFYKESKQYSG